MAKKRNYKIGEACRALDVQPYVLRYWETEFSFLNPTKSKSGQRVYGEKELELIRRIKTLLYEEGYTIAGAKKKLEAEAGAPKKDEPAKDRPAMDQPKKDQPGKIPPRQNDLRAGVESALGQARELLEMLESR